MITIAFLGTPSIGSKALESIINHKDIKVVVVVTVPDRAIGRSHSTLKPSPVAELASKHNIDIIKTNSINNDIELLKKYKFDYLLTCAFGQFLSDEVLSTPMKKALNIHGSLLPEGRGGAPLHWAIINGKKETGISIMEMVSKMDAGDYYEQFKLPIDINDNVDNLFNNMSNLILDKTANGIVNIDKGMKPTKQNESKVTFWLNVKKEDSKIDFNKDSISVYNQIRGLDSKPGAWSVLDGKVIKIHKSEVLEEKNTRKKPGTIVDINKDGIKVQTKNGLINLLEVTLENGKRNSVSILINGRLKNVKNLIFE